MSGDQAIKFRIWSHAGTMYRYMSRPADAWAANEVARNLRLTRPDPLFASLGLARQAAIHSMAQNCSATHRAFEQAQDAMLRDDPADLSAGVSAHLLRTGRAELLGHLRVLVARRLPDRRVPRPPLSVLPPAPPGQNPAITTTRLAHAQLVQGAADAATATAMKVPAGAATRHARASRMLQELGAALGTTAPGSTIVQTWTEPTTTWRIDA